MIGYITLGTNNISRAEKFYDGLFSVVEIKQLYKLEELIGWGTSFDSTVLAVTVPFNKESASVGNGTMVALKAKTNELVIEMHKKAIELGAVDEGAPGFRTERFFGAYVRDLDGNKLAFYCV